MTQDTERLLAEAEREECIECGRTQGEGHHPDCDYKAEDIGAPAASAVRSARIEAALLAVADAWDSWQMSSVHDKETWAPMQAALSEARDVLDGAPTSVGDTDG